MLRLAWKTVKHNPKRLILTTIAIVLGTSFVSGTFVLTNAMQNSFDSMFDEIYGNMDIQVVPADDNQATTGFALIVPSFDESWVERIAAVEGVERVSPTVSGTATMMDAEGKPMPMGPPVIVMNWNEPPDLDNVTLVSGHYPQFDNQVVLDLDAAAKAGYEIGDTVTFYRYSEAEPLLYTLVGTAQFGKSNALNGATLAFFTYTESQSIARLEGEVAGVSVKVAEGYDIETVRDSIQGIIASDMEAKLSSESIQEQSADVSSIINMMNTFVLIFAFIAVIVGALLITNTFQTIITQRTKELGLLRAIAATPRQITTMILLEAFIIGVIGSVIGITFGYGMTYVNKYLLSHFAGLASNIGTLSIPLPALTWGFATGIGTTLVAALLPALHASRISPMEALRDEATRARKGLGVRDLIGLAFFVLTGVGVVLAILDPFWPKAAWVGVAAGMALIGTILVSASLVDPIARWLTPGFRRLFRVNGTLAMNNARREPRRTANTMGALIFGVMLLTLMTTVFASIKSVITDTLTGTTSATFIVGGNFMSDPLAPISQGEITAMGEVDNVTTVHFFGWDTVTFDGEAVDIVAIDSKTADAAYVYDAEPDISTLDDGEIFVSPTVLDEGYSLGDTVTLTGADGSLDFTIVGTYLEEGDPGLWITFHDGTVLHHGLAAMNALIVTTDGADQEAVRSGLEAAVADNPRLEVTSTDEYSAAINSTLDSVLGILTVLLSMALVISIFGVANTLFLSVAERTREIGLLRAVGISRKSVRSMIRLESVFMSLLGAFLGAILGIAAGAGLVMSFDIFGGRSGVTIPWVNLVIFTILAILAGIVAAILPARRASRLNILEAVTTE
jgi:putative ABC transport system permease protein